MGHPHHASKGFQRPVQIFTKSDLSPSQSQRSYSITPSHTVTSQSAGKQVYTCLTSPYFTPNNQSQRSASGFSITPSHIITSNSNTEAAPRRVYTCLPSPIGAMYEKEEFEGKMNERSAVKELENSDDICDSTEDRGGTERVQIKQEDGAKNGVKDTKSFKRKLSDADEEQNNKSAKKEEVNDCDTEGKNVDDT